MIVSQYDQYLRKIHVNIFSLTVIKKESSILAWNVQNFTWVLFLPPTLPLIQSKQAQLQ